MAVTDVDTILQNPDGPGIAKSASETFSQWGLQLSQNPVPKFVDYILKAGETLKRHQVVGLDAGKLVVSTGAQAGADHQTAAAAPVALPGAGYGTAQDGLVWPIGYVGAPFSRASSGADSLAAADNKFVVPVCISGHFNIDALEWDDSWFHADDDDSDANKAAQDLRLIQSVVGAPSPIRLVFGVHELHRRPTRVPA